MLIEANYDGIKRRCNSWAFRFYLGPDDLRSAVGQRLAESMATSGFKGSEDQFWSYMHRLIYWAAIDLKRRQKPPYVEISEVAGYLEDREQNFEVRDMIRSVKSSLPEDLTHNECRVFEMYVFGEMKYREIAERLNIPIGSVKTFIHRARQVINEKYGRRYREIMA